MLKGYPRGLECVGIKEILTSIKGKVIKTFAVMIFPVLLVAIIIMYAVGEC